MGRSIPPETWAFFHGESLPPAVFVPCFLPLYRYLSPLGTGVCIHHWSLVDIYLAVLK
jgi:hypothetical protein